MRCFRSVAICLGVAFMISTDATAAIHYTQGHGDIGIAIDGDELFLHYHFDGSAVLDGFEDPFESEHEPEDVLTILSEPPVARPDGSDWDFIGVAAGDPIYLIAQIQDYQPNNPWLGFGTEEIEPGTITGLVRYEVTNVTGPGHFSIFAEGAFGNPLIEVSSINNDFTFEIPDGTHAHYNISFTAPGIYTMDLTASLDLASGGTLTDSGTFTFQVATVPEPAGVVLAIFGAIAVVGMRHRKISFEAAA